jgi:hypothetical protein
MVRGQDIRTADKNVVDWGSWASGGMQTTAFPLSKRQRRSYRLGSAYRWRVVRFEANTGAGVTTCRLLIAYNPAKEQFRATLAAENDRDMSVIASYEFHGTHPGWHMHAACGDIEKIQAGSMRGPWQRRIPPPRQLHRRTEFGVSSDDAALEVAARVFRLHKKPGSLPI